MSSEEMLVGVQRRDADAEQALFEKYFYGALRRLQSYFKYRPEVDIESLAQTMLLDFVLAIRLGRIQDPRKLSGYFNSIVLNESRELFRKRRYEVPMPMFSSEMDDTGTIREIDAISSVDIEAQLLKQERLGQLHRAIAYLPPEQQMVMLSCLWGDDVVAQSRITGEYVGTLKSRKWRAIEKIRKTLGLTDAQSHTEAEEQAPTVKARAAGA